MIRTATAPERRSMDFIDNDRTFTCVVAPRLAREVTLWWWFSVDGNNSRYAPFVADADESDASVRTRILAYYEDHLARRAAPATPRWRRAAS